MERGLWILLTTLGLTMAAGCTTMQGGAPDTPPLMDDEVGDDSDENEVGIGN